MSPEVPNWETQRLQLDRMKGLRSESTHWRIICSFDPASVVGYRDYVRAKFKNFNLLTYRSDKTCELLDYMNFYGHSYEKCTAVQYQSAGYILFHRSYKKHCEFGRVLESIQDNDRYREQNFGRYEVYNPNFRCTSSSSATTNYWFGLRV